MDQPTDRQKSPWAAIQDQLDAGEMDQAKENIQALIKSQPENLETWLCEAQYQLEVEAWDAADMAIAQARMLAPRSSRVDLLSARYALSTDNTHEAVSQALQATHSASTTGEKSEAQLALADFTLAHLAALSALRADSAGPDDEFDEEYEDPDEAEERKEALQQAITALRDLVAASPTSTTGWRKLALLHEADDNTDKALDAWEEADKLSPDTPDILHGVARNLERLEYNQDAYELYQTLYDLERDAANSSDGLLFSPERFAEAAKDAWQTLFKEWSLDAQPVQFVFESGLYPPPSMLEEASPDDIFDPRVGLHVAFVSDFTQDLPTVKLIIYQRNIERDLEGDDATSLSLAFADLIEQCLTQIFAILDQSDEDNW